ncbi:Csu type fimbrial protein [Janthinobacterium aquaticum]|uniref:Csu type fimbrial protein n=1 Tax=Janthinobacterium sp. FT58W TaxID=2654254 RepID=UPI00126563CC|nr:spore coat U domain-containing protein [Janthinobacterium sp. FT58W]KAB8042050.1 pilus assembly protein [Janthinobacterium sp. FT58W]
MRRAWVVLALLLAWTCSGQAQAQGNTCTVVVNEVNFGLVSPISGADYTVTGSGTLTCIFAPLAPLLTGYVSACLNLGLGSNSLAATARQLGNGTLRMPYNLYVDSSYAPSAIWGGPGVTGAPSSLPVSISMGLLSLGGTATKNFSFYGKIPSGTALAAVSTVADANTEYSSSFTGAGTLTYTFSSVTPPTNCLGSTASFGFAVKATAVNNCTITATPMVFSNATILTGSVRSTSTLTVRCVNNNAYQIALNGGTVAGSVAARQMKNTVSAARVGYRLSSTLDGPLWGDGTGGTAMVNGKGTGSSVPVTIYGRVPAQTTPEPGDYKDTVMATIYF